MDRSTYTAMLAMFRERPRNGALSRESIQNKLFDLCKIKICYRDIQTLIGMLQADGLRIISEKRGYWTLSDNATAEEIEAANHAATTLRAHAESELSHAQTIDNWIEDVVKIKQRKYYAGFRVAKQEGLFEVHA